MTLWQMTKRYGFHFTSLIAVIVFMLSGYSPMLAVFYSTLLCFALSFIRPETALKGRKLVRSLADGSIGVLNAATTCASAGIIVGVVTLTGLGLKFSSIVLDYAGGSLLLTALYTALIVWIVGLAVPVTASYIICAVIAAPALIKLGVPDYAAHMFIFYYAVLSEVSPPTALSPFAAAAITGGDPYLTTMQAWKYTLPAFLVPFVFILDPEGVGLLMKIPHGRLDLRHHHRSPSRPRPGSARWPLRPRTGRCARTRRASACRGSWPGFCWCFRACWRRWRNGSAATMCRTRRRSVSPLRLLVLLKQYLTPSRLEAAKS